VSIEIGAMIVAAVIALINLYLAFTKETTRGRRFAVGLTALFAAIGGVAFVEQQQRTKSMAAFAQQVERKWIILQDANVDALEFEMILPDGQVHLEDLLDDAQKIRFKIDGVHFHLGAEQAGQNAVNLSQVISIDNLSKNGRLGTAAFGLAPARDKDSINDTRNVNCFASKFTTEHIFARLSTHQTLDQVCSATMILPVNSAVSLATIFASPKISLTITDPRKLTCMGICKEGMLPSVKLLFPDTGPLQRTAIEVSPFSYLDHASAASEQEKTFQFELSGDSLSQLAKSHFLQSYGYKDQGHFPLTPGLFHYLLSLLFTRKATVQLVDVVWTTNPSPSLESLTNAVAHQNRASVDPFKVGEWCGFGEHPFCWYTFNMYAPPSN
jgi:hypothetical protein